MTIQCEPTLNPEPEFFFAIKRLLGKLEKLNQVYRSKLLDQFHNFDNYTVLT